MDDPIARYRALFERDGRRYVPTPLARGPWDFGALHGGAPAALFAVACERHDPGPASFVARLTVELLRPVPLAPLELHVRTMRPGKKVQWLEASLRDEDEREVAHATALRIRVDEVDTTGSVQPNIDAPPGPDAQPATLFPFTADAVGYWTANDVRMVRGTWTEPGPGMAWIRLRCEVIAGEHASPFSRVAAAADFGSGVGNPVRMTSATAINPELTVHVHRHPAGDWVGLESGAWAQPHGVGLAETRLYDARGVIGRAAQALLVEPAMQRPFAV
ncbi:MAG TPA: thioesterase family protein [Acidimicrobiia bacterium]|nr:thioesterase family protein [Acidimicrobiia bacterium]